MIQITRKRGGRWWLHYGTMPSVKQIKGTRVREDFKNWASGTENTSRRLSWPEQQSAKQKARQAAASVQATTTRLLFRWSFSGQVGNVAGNSKATTKLRGQKNSITSKRDRNRSKLRTQVEEQLTMSNFTVRRNPAHKWYYYEFTNIMTFRQTHGDAISLVQIQKCGSQIHKS